MAQPTITRKALLAAALGQRTVTSVDVRQITLAPGQQTGRHFHPCHVIGYIVSGAAELEIEGQPPQPLPAGAAFHEPADTIIARFDNVSPTEPMTFIACYLLRADEELIQMLTPDAVAPGAARKSRAKKSPPAGRSTERRSRR